MYLVLGWFLQTCCFIFKNHKDLPSQFYRKKWIIRVRPLTGIQRLSGTKENQTQVCLIPKPDLFHITTHLKRVRSSFGNMWNLWTHIGEVSGHSFLCGKLPLFLDATWERWSVRHFIPRPFQAILTWITQTFSCFSSLEVLAVSHRAYLNYIF